MEFKHGSTARAPGIRERRYARSRTGALNAAHILIVGGGIGGLTSAIALRARGFTVDVVERDPNWSVYGVGIIQQANVIRAMSQLGLLGDYLKAGFGFDQVDIYAPNGQKLASVPSPKPSNDYPANVGIGRRDRPHRRERVEPGGDGEHGGDPGAARARNDLGPRLGLGVVGMTMAVGEQRPALRQIAAF